VKYTSYSKSDSVKSQSYGTSSPRSVNWTSVQICCKSLNTTQHNTIQYNCRTIQ